MPQRIAKVAQEYAQRQIKVGEAFEVEPQHVGLLLTLGRIEPEEAESRDMGASAPGDYMTRALTAAKPRGRPRKGVAQ